MNHILPMVGYGSVRLGSTRDAIQQQLGEPDEVKLDTFPDDTSQESWSYPALGCVLQFHSDEEWLLAAIDVQHSDATVGGERLLGTQEPIFLAALERAGISDVTLDDEFEDSRCYESKDSELTFWVEYGELETITIWPRYDSSGNTPLWPTE